jgi:hypothetical protein
MKCRGRKSRYRRFIGGRGNLESSQRTLSLIREICVCGNGDGDGDGDGVDGERLGLTFSLSLLLSLHFTSLRKSLRIHLLLHFTSLPSERVCDFTFSFISLHLPQKEFAISFLASHHITSLHFHFYFHFTSLHFPQKEFAISFLASHHFTFTSLPSERVRDFISHITSLSLHFHFHFHFTSLRKSLRFHFSQTQMKSQNKIYDL